MNVFINVHFQVLCFSTVIASMYVIYFLKNKLKFLSEMTVKVNAILN